MIPFRLAGLFFLFTCSVAGGVATAQPDDLERWETLRVVPEAGVNVRSTPSSKSEKISTLSENAEVRAVVERKAINGEISSSGTAEWTEVELSDGRRGYVATRFLRSTSNSSVLGFWFICITAGTFYAARWKRRSAFLWTVLSVLSLGVAGIVLLFIPETAKAQQGIEKEEAADPSAENGRGSIYPALKWTLLLPLTLTWTFLKLTGLLLLGMLGVSAARSVTASSSTRRPIITFSDPDVIVVGMVQRGSKWDVRINTRDRAHPDSLVTITSSQTGIHLGSWVGHVGWSD